MSGSYTKINYLTRPAKATQRKMIVEALHRLDRLTPALADYQYVGFGSPFFTDFKLFHRSLGIQKMFSIEGEVEDAIRFRYNRPFKCVKLLMGWSTEMLDRINLKKPSVVWLDYDYMLKSHVLTDVSTVMGSFTPGSVLLVTLDAEPSELIGRAERFGEDLGDLTPQGLTDEELGDLGIALQSRRMISDRIAEVLEARNASLEVVHQLTASQFLFFTYADGHLMTTLGWLVGQGQIEMSRCAFDDLPFFNDSADPTHIAVPSITLKEMQHLSSQLPAVNVEGMNRKRIPIEHVQLYADQYRWLPTFVDADL